MPFALGAGLFADGFAALAAAGFLGAGFFFAGAGFFAAAAGFFAAGAGAFFSVGRASCFFPATA